MTGSIAIELRLPNVTPDLASSPKTKVRRDDDDRLYFNSLQRQSVSQSVSGGSEIPEGFGAASIEHWTMEAGMLDWVGWSVVRGNNK
jgi:hypothetical protein